MSGGTDPRDGDDSGRTRPREDGILRFAFSSWRTLSVALLSFSSGLPLGIVWILIPDWMRKSGYDIRLVGLITIAHAPWSFKLLWSPLMDRYKLPFLGRRRGWMALTQVALIGLGLGLAALGDAPDAHWVLLALALGIAVASASQDIVIDAYAVEVLRLEEQGPAVGLRTASYRAAMLVAGAAAITLLGYFSWAAVNVFLTALYLPMLLVTLRAPEPEVATVVPLSLREAIWEPFLGFMARHRAMEILAFVVLYKFCDQLSQALLRPFLIDMGFSDFDWGVAVGTVGIIGTAGGAILGGALTTVLGLGRSLWFFGFLQIFSNLGYLLIVYAGANRPLMYGAYGFETLTSGMGMGAFGVLLLRLTQRRFSATQYALFSSLFALPRVIAGPITGFVVHAFGWGPFFWITMVAGIPGMVLLARFSPWGEREPTFTVEPASGRPPLAAGGLFVRGLATGFVALGVGATVQVGILFLNAHGDGVDFDAAAALSGTLWPESVKGWLVWAGIVACALLAGLVGASYAAARHGSVPESQQMLD